MAIERGLPLAERLDLKSVPDPTTGCLLYMGCTDTKGYGKFSVAHQRWRFAHRVAWELVHGSVPEGLFVLHRCDTPACVEVNHLFLGTLQDNAADMVAKKRHRPRGLTPIHIGERQRRKAAGRKV